MRKEARLNLRLNPELKRWLRRYSTHRGGMSKVITRVLEGMRETESDGGRQDPGDPEEEAGN